MNKNKHKKGTKEIYKMCAGLNAIKGLTPEEILSAYNKNGVPVDIEGVIKSLNIKILSRDFKDIEEENKKLIDEKGEILGAVVFNGDDVIIFTISSKISLKAG